jgi:hypothetical protein
VTLQPGRSNPESQNTPRQRRLLLIALLANCSEVFWPLIACVFTTDACEVLLSNCDVTLCYYCANQFEQLTLYLGRVHLTMLLHLHTPLQTVSNPKVAPVSRHYKTQAGVPIKPHKSTFWVLRAALVFFAIPKKSGRDSSVSIATGLRSGWGEVRFPAGATIFLYSTEARPALGPTQPPIQWVPGTVYPGEKRPGAQNTANSFSVGSLLSLCVCMRITPIVARQRLGKHVLTTTNKHGTIQEMLDASFSMRFMSHQRKVGD